jgi:hypothetical protein
MKNESLLPGALIVIAVTAAAFAQKTQVTGDMLRERPTTLTGLVLQARNETVLPVEYTYMEVHVLAGGQTANEKFFLGRLPHEGEAVEMVYVGSKPDGTMRFQLRTREQAP